MQQSTLMARQRTTSILRLLDEAEHLRRYSEALRAEAVALLAVRRRSLGLAPRKRTASARSGLQN
jgi:hypothetical protein